MSTPPPPRYRFGTVVSVILAAWLATLGLMAAFTPDLGWGVLPLLIGAVLVGIPLFAVLVITYVSYLVRDKGRMSPRTHAVLLLPTLLSALIYPLRLSYDNAKHDFFRDANPVVSETHVNMSGRDLWIDTRPYGAVNFSPPMRGKAPEIFAAFERYPTPESVETGIFPYENARLKPGITHYQYRSASGEASDSLPMTQPAQALPPAARPALLARDENTLRYLYFHYPDRVEVATALDAPAGSTIERLERGKRTDLTLFSTQNYTSGALARLEINGQAMDLGAYAHAPIPVFPAPCHDTPRPAGFTNVDLQRPLAVRWQTLDAPQRWQTGTVLVPAFRKPEPIKGESPVLRVQLYFLPDGTVEAERFVEVHRKRSKLGLRATGLPERANMLATCRGALVSRYDEDRVDLLSD